MPIKRLVAARWPRLVLLGLLMVSEPTFAADPACRWTLDTFLQCATRIVVHRAGERSAITRYRNGEGLEEWQAGDRTMRALWLGPGPRVLLEGQPPDDPLRMYAPLMIGWGGLVRSHRDGPASIPTHEDHRTIVVDGHAWSVVTWRPAAGRIGFRVAADDAPGLWVIEGEVTTDVIEPLPDDHPLDGWKASDGATFATVGDAR